MKSNSISNSLALPVVIASVFIGLMIFSSGARGVSTTGASVNNVSVVDGKQIVEIVVRGGYSPRLTVGKANIPTVIRMKTTGTFDCSSAVVIPSIGYRAYLPASGVTDIPVPAQKSGTTLQGSCAMGMYSFAVEFK